MTRRRRGRFARAVCPLLAAQAVLLALLAMPAATAAAGTGSPATVAAATGAVRGLDVSSFQHAAGAPIDWRRLARIGVRFAGIKVSEGTYYANPYYLVDARAARAAGVAVLPYVFANPRRSGGAATAAFAVAASRRAGKTLPLAVDLENDPYARRDRGGHCYGLRVPAMIAWIGAFTRETARLTGARPVIYTTADWWRQCTGNTARFRADALWVAAYGVRAPAVPAPWKEHWTFWQYSDRGKLPGVGVTDLDYFRLARRRGDNSRITAPSRHRVHRRRPRLGASKAVR